MRVPSILLALISPFILFGQSDQTRSLEPPINLGLLFFVSDLERFPDNSRGPRDFLDFYFGLRFTSEYRFRRGISIRVEPGVVQSKYFYRGDNNVEIEVPILIKYAPLRRSRFNPYIIGGYLANYKFQGKLIDIDAVRRKDFFEYGIGIDLKLKKSTIGFGLRYNSEILMRREELKANSFMLFLSFDNR